MAGPMVLIFLTFCVAVILAAKEHVNFGYSGPRGPEHWAEDYESCFGKHQSPINIEEHDVRDVYLPALVFSGLELPRTLSMINNGHTALLHASDNSRQTYMSGGPLNGAYVFEQLHFHWGENDREGSEDLINNHSFAMELHAVFYKKDYGSMNQATKYSDGLAVIAYFFEADSQDESNPMFATVVKALPEIEKVGTETKLPDGMKLGDLLDPIGSPDDWMQNYFTYNGSLTTPPCSEIVTWIDFKYPLYLSHAQIAAFRDIRSIEGQKLTHNFRPVQPLSDRLVMHNSPRKEVSEQIKRIQDDDQSSADHMRGSLTIMLCLLILLGINFIPYNQR